MKKYRYTDYMKKYFQDHKEELAVKAKLRKINNSHGC